MTGLRRGLAVDHVVDLEHPRFAGVDPGYPVVDALDIHVDVLAQLAAGRTLGG